MTIALLLAHSERGGSIGSPCTSEAFIDDSDMNDVSDQSSPLPNKTTKFPGFDKLVKRRNPLIGGGNLILCPMTLLGQWKVLGLHYIIPFFFFLHGIEIRISKLHLGCMLIYIFMFFVFAC